jgi:stress-induced-phosphoprotein 1
MENDKKSPVTKELGNQCFKEKKYLEAIEVYRQILDSYNENKENNDTSDKHIILSNRAAAYIKEEMWDEALRDAINSIEIKSDSGKAWGRLGAALFGQGKLDEALAAYNKANKLEPSTIYTEMIEKIKQNCKEINNMVSNEFIGCMQNPSIEKEDLFNKMIDSVISNPQILEKLNNPEFQNKLLSFQSKPLEALKDKELMDIMTEMMKNF